MEPEDIKDLEDVAEDENIDSTWLNIPYGITLADIEKEITE